MQEQSSEWTHGGWYYPVQLVYPPGGGGNFIAGILDSWNPDWLATMQRDLETNEYIISGTGRINLWHPEQIFHKKPDMRCEPSLARAKWITNVVNNNGQKIVVWNYEGSQSYIEALNKLKNRKSVRPVNANTIQLTKQPEYVRRMLAGCPFRMKIVDSQLRKYTKAVKHLKNTHTLNYHKVFFRQDRHELNKLKQFICGTDITDVEYDKAKEELWNYMHNNCEALLEFTK
jgi:hypothetical protein